MGCGGNKQASEPQQLIDKPKPNRSSTGSEKGKATTEADKDDAKKTALEEVSSKLLVKYIVGEVLGQGTYGIVYACRPRSGNQDCAVKMVDKVETPVDRIMREARFLRMMNHQNVVKCFDVIEEKCFVCIVMERVTGGDLIQAMQAHWKSKGTIPMMATLHIGRQMSESMKYLHDMFIVHRDVKGDNFLTTHSDISTSDVRIVLTDFGTVTDCPPGTRLRDKCGTKLFWSPEFYSRDYALKVDIWAVGVVFYGLLKASFPFKNETEVRTKIIRLTDSTPEPVQKLTFAMLEKSEEKRIDAAQVSKHPGLHFETKSRSYSQDTLRSELPPKEDMIVREAGANEGVNARRQELFERLQDVFVAMSKGQSGSTMRSATIKDTHYWKDKFCIRERIGRGSEVWIQYEWWTNQQIAKDLDMSFVEGKKGDVQEKRRGQKSIAFRGEGDRGSVQVIEDMLLDHSVDTSKFGTGEAKTLEKFVQQVYEGTALLMLDASQHKKLVRVVNVVCLRICTIQKGTKMILLETGEVMADGRKKSLQRLPATLKKPHENTRQAAERLERTFLFQGKVKVKFDWAIKEVFEESEESPSYPGVQTVYHKEIIEGKIVEKIDTKKKVRKEGEEEEISGEISEELRHNMLSTATIQAGTGELGTKTKLYKWFAEKTCREKNIQYKAPEEGKSISALVHAPIGMSNEDLEQKLKAHGIDVTKFGKEPGTKTLSDLSAELIKGESVLAEDEHGQLTRIVDIVVVKLQHPLKGTLVTVQQTHSDGTVKELKRLPGAKRRPDENQFITARRMLKKTLKVNDDHVVMKEDAVEVIEESKTSIAYPGIRALYRKRLIPALLIGEAEPVSL